MAKLDELQQYSTPFLKLKKCDIKILKLSEFSPAIGGDSSKPSSAKPLATDKDK
jgi:hypothetical protein